MYATLPPSLETYAPSMATRTAIERRQETHVERQHDIEDILSLGEYKVKKPTSIKEIVRQAIENLGYTIAGIEEKTIDEDGYKIKILTYELYEEIEDYAKLLQQEKEITKKLNLPEKNIVLELV